MGVCLLTKWLWVWVQLQSLRVFSIRLFFTFYMSERICCMNNMRHISMWIIVIIIIQVAFRWLYSAIMHIAWQYLLWKFFWNNASLSKFLRSQEDHLKRPKTNTSGTFLLKFSFLDQSVVGCSKCFGVYSRKFFCRHRNRCGDSGVCPVLTNLKMATANIASSDMLRRNVVGT